VALFAYRGRNGRGELVQGVMEGHDAGAVADQLFSTGVTPVEITGSRASARERLAGARGLRRISSVDLMVFSRQMHTLIRSGVPMLRALAGLQESATNAAFARILLDVRASLDSGRELSAALQRHPQVFSAYYVAMVRVGETTGRLEEVFDRLAAHIEFEKEMRDRVKSALRYPAFVMAAMVAAVVIINIFVIPVFAEVFKGFNAPLPAMTRLLIGVSQFFVHFWPVLAAAVFAAVFGFRAYVRTPAGRRKWDALKLRLPIAGKIILKATLARFARSFALAIKSGVPIVQALSVVSDVVENVHVAERIAGMREGVERGESVLRTAVAAEVFTPVVLQMIAVGDETGELDALLFEVAGYYEREVDYELKSLSAQIEPILIIFLGVLVLILALGVFLPLWSLGSVALKR
jgi:MSHA biogenesis protein MshG